MSNKHFQKSNTIQTDQCRIKNYNAFILDVEVLLVETSITTECS